MSWWRNGPKCSQTHFLPKINALLPWNKVAQTFGLPLHFSQNLNKVNNRPIGEKLPNLVTLAVNFVMRSGRVSLHTYLGSWFGPKKHSQFLLIPSIYLYMYRALEYIMCACCDDIGAYGPWDRILAGDRVFLTLRFIQINLYM
jgi:hypothetical protein